MAKVDKAITPEDFAAKMAEIFPAGGYDIEGAHHEADKLMLELLDSLGYRKGCIVFELADKYYA